MQLNLGLHAFHSAIGGGRKCVWLGGQEEVGQKAGIPV